MPKKKRANGEGSCYQIPGGLWRAVDARRTVYRTGKTQREAMARRDAALVAADSGVIRSNSTVTDYLAGWLASKSATIRPTTAATYRSLVATHITPAIGPVLLADLSAGDVQRAIDHASKLSAATMRHVYRLLHSALEHARKTKLIAFNPAESAIIPAKQKADVRPLYDDALSAFMAQAAGDRLEALWLLAVGFGPRRGEAIAIALDDLRLEQDPASGQWRGAVTIRRSLQRVKAQGLVFLPPKSARGYRTVELPAIAVDAVRRWLDRRAAEKAACRHWQESGLLFCSRIGTPLEPRNVTRRFQELLALAGVTRNKLHALRHTAASLMLRDGTDPKQVQEIMGHSSAAMTMDTYGHLLPGRSAAAAAKMNDSLTRLRIEVV